MSNRREDLSGMVFGKWTVISFSHCDYNNKSYFNCKCRCGTPRIVQSDGLKNGRSKSCGPGCALNKFKGNDLSGKVIGHIKIMGVVKDGSQHKVHSRKYNCKCLVDGCGREYQKPHLQLRNSKTLTCGCRKGVSHRLKKGEAGFLHCFRQYKKGAKDRGYAFSLNKNQFKTLTNGDCYYCGEPPSQISRPYRKNENLRDLIYKEYINHSKYVYNGIDRVDNKKGYIFSNCVPCCFKCNKLKKSSGGMDFKRHIIKIATRIGSR